MPFYVSPEQLMKDRADYARKGIGRGRSVAVVQYADGVLFVSENPSQALHKISELYDRIAFAAVGRYNEFENLRIAGVRLADMRGYSYDRRDVTGRGLANAYAQTLGAIFSSGAEKPYEVEIFVAELGATTAEDQIFRLTYDGQVADEQGYAAMGGQAESVTTYLAERWASGLALPDALRLAVSALGHGESGDRRIPVTDLEAAVLDRTRAQQRKFRRLDDITLSDALGGPGGGPGGGDGSDGPAPTPPAPTPPAALEPEAVAPEVVEPEAVAPEVVEPEASLASRDEALSSDEEARRGDDETPAPGSGPQPAEVEQRPSLGEEAPDETPTAPEPEPTPPAVTDDREDLWPPVAPPPEPHSPQPRADRPPPPPGVRPEVAAPTSHDLHDETVEEEWPVEPDGLATPEGAAEPESEDPGYVDPEDEAEPPRESDAEHDAESDDETDAETTDGGGWHPFWRREDS